jgi:hypothetical protein
MEIEKIDFQAFKIYTTQKELVLVNNNLING